MKREQYILTGINHIQGNRRGRFLIELIMKIMLLSGVFAILFCFLLDQQAQIIVIVGGVLALLYTEVLAISDKQEQFWMNVLPVLAGVVILFIRPLGTYRGIMYWINQWISVWNNKFDEYAALYAVDAASMADRTQVFLAIGILAACLISFAIKRENLLIILVLGLGVFFLAGYFGLQMPILGACMMLCGGVMFWVYSVTGFQAGTKLIGAWILVMVVLGLLGGLTIGYQGSVTVANLKQSIHDRIEYLRYGEDTLPQGQMDVAYAMVGDDTTDALQLSFDTAQEMYLKGYVGSTFDGQDWSELSKAAYSGEEAGMLNWLKTNGFAIYNQYTQYQQYTDQEDMKSGTISVENVGADRRYLYLPYETKDLLSNGGEEKYDWQMCASGFLGERNYSAEVVQDETPAELTESKSLNLSIEGADVYQEAERVYSSFVLKNYLDVSEEDKAELNRLIYNDEDWSSQGLYQITMQIRLYMQQATTYTDHPQSYTSDTGFIKWFLEEQKAGNASYYATVATLAYRTAGIPARYVEGYRLSTADASQLNADKQTQATLSQADTHAWVEVYMDQIGWMPVEVVPGFYYAEYTTQQILNAPQSTVNIKNQTADQQLNGSTADSIQEKTQEDAINLPENVKRVIYTAGICVFIILLIWLLHFIVRIQYQWRRRRYKERLEHAPAKDAGRIRYERVSQLFTYGGITFSREFPYENIPRIKERYPDIQIESYERFVELVQKSVFGELDLDKAELLTVERFEEMVADQVYLSLDKRKQIVMKYVKAYH